MSITFRSIFMLPKHYSLECLLSLIGLLSCLHFSRLGKHCVHGVFSTPTFSHESVRYRLPILWIFLGHRKSWNRRNFCRVSHLNKNIEKKSTSFFTSFLDNLKSLKVNFAWLTLMSALFPCGKILCPWCFSSHQLSLMEKLCTRFSCLGKTIHVCLSYSTLSVMRVFGMASQFYGFFRTQKIQKNRRNLCRVHI